MTATAPPLQTLSGQLMLPDGVKPGRLVFSRNIIEVVDEGAAPGNLFILPGFIDTHVHGGGGGDTMDGAEGIRTLARLHALHGTTTILPTTMTQAWPEVLAALQAVRDVMTTGVNQGADIPGAHLEGPFISPGRLGAQPPYTQVPTAEHIDELLELDVVRAVTLAPEIDGALNAALRLGRAGVRIGVGHTCAQAPTVTTFLNTLTAAGIQTTATHLFNAMGGIEGRAPGVPGALLTDPAALMEVILDGQHVHAISFLLARAAAPERVMLITDAMRAAGLGDGPSELGGQAVTVREGRATLDCSGSLAGSVLTMDAALRHAVQTGVPLAEASRMASGIPAASLNLKDRGWLKEALRADLVVLNEKLEVQAVYVAGQRLQRNEGELPLFMPA